MLSYPLRRSTNILATGPQFNRDVESLWSELFGPSETRSTGFYEAQASQNWSPACEIEEAKDHYLLTLETAGVPKDKIQMETIGNQLLITGEKTASEDRNEGQKLYSERRHGKFQRRFTLPTDVNAELVEANYQDGILRVYIPKPEVIRPKQIKINLDSNTNPEKSFFGRLMNKTPKKEEEAMHSSKESHPATFKSKVA